MRGRLNHHMLHSESGVLYLAGKDVEVLEVDEGESWEPSITKVRHNEDVVWVNSKDVEITEQ